MASILSSEYVTKTINKNGNPTAVKALFVSRLKNFETNEAALADFNAMVQCYTLMCGDLDVQADGSMFEANLGEGKSMLLELNYDF